MVVYPRHLLGFLAVTEAMDINIDPSCCKAMELDTALGSNSGSDVILALGVSSGHSAQHGSSGSSKALSTNTALGGGPDPEPGHPCGS